MDENLTGGKFHFVGNLLWLDFVNTEAIADGQREDLLGNETDFAEWALETGVLTQEEADSIPAASAETLAQVRAFRAVLRQMAAAITSGTARPADAIAAVNLWLTRRNLRLTLKQTATGFAKIARQQWADWLDALAPIAESAADLLTTGDFSLLRKCENPQCILYFYDTSKNHARRWCSMSGCGNRHKVAEHYRRKKGGVA